MSKIKHSGFFRTVSLVLIAAFISFDATWAYPSGPNNANNSTLATPSSFQQQPISDQAARISQSFFSQGGLSGSACSIAKYLLEDRLPLKHLERVISAELGNAVEGFDLSRVMVKEGVVSIPCEIEGKKRTVQIALKDNPAAASLTGQELLRSDRYVAIILPEDHAISGAKSFPTRKKESLAVYKDSRETSEDGRYYIKEEITTNPQNRAIVGSFVDWGAKGYLVNDGVIDHVLYAASGQKIISGEEIFGEDKNKVSLICLRFTGKDTFIAYGEGRRENLILYAYKISNGKPVFMYKVYGGDCSSIYGTGVSGISEDGMMMKAFEITGTYDDGDAKNYYTVLRFKGEIIKEYPVGFEGAVFPLNNGSWIEVEGNAISLYSWKSGREKLIKTITVLRGGEMYFQDDFFILVEDLGGGKSNLIVFDKNKAVKLAEKEAALEGKAFYVDPLDFTVVKIEDIGKKDIYSVAKFSPELKYAGIVQVVDSGTCLSAKIWADRSSNYEPDTMPIRSSPGRRYVVVKHIARTPDALFSDSESSIYEYRSSALSNRQNVGMAESFGFLQSERPASGAKSFPTGKEEDPAQVAYDKGLMLFMMGQAEAAIEAFTQAIEANPLFVDAFYNRGNARRKLGDNENARIDFSRAIELKPRYADAWYNLGKTYKDLGMPDDAITALYKAIEIEPVAIDARFALANTLLSQEKYEAAARYYKEILVLEPGFTPAIVNLRAAKTMIAEKNIDKSIDQLYGILRAGDIDTAVKRALELVDSYPSSAKAYATLGFVYGCSGVSVTGPAMLDLSIEAYRKSLKLDSTRDIVHEGLAVQLQKKSMDEEAKSEYETAIALSKDPNGVPHAMLNLGAIYYNEGLNNKALRQFLAVVERCSSHPQIIASAKTNLVSIGKAALFMAREKFSMHNPGDTEPLTADEIRTLRTIIREHENIPGAKSFPTRKGEDVGNNIKLDQRPLFITRWHSDALTILREAKKRGVIPAGGIKLINYDSHPDTSGFGSEGSWVSTAIKEGLVAEYEWKAMPPARRYYHQEVGFFEELASPLKKRAADDGTKREEPFSPPVVVSVDLDYFGTWDDGELEQDIIFELNEEEILSQAEIIGNRSSKQLPIMMIVSKCSGYSTTTTLNNLPRIQSALSGNFDLAFDMTEGPNSDKNADPNKIEEIFDDLLPRISGAKSFPTGKDKATADAQDEAPENLVVSPITKDATDTKGVVEKARFIYTIDKSLNLPPLGAFPLSPSVSEEQLREWHWQIEACLNQVCAGIAVPSHTTFPNMINIKVVSGLSSLSEVALGKEPREFTILLDEELLKSLDAKWLLYMELEHKLLRMCIRSLKNRLPPAAEDIALTLVYLARFNSFEERKRQQTITFLNRNPNLDVHKFRDVLIDSRGSSPEELAEKIAVYHNRKSLSCDQEWLGQSIPIWCNAMTLLAYSNILANLLKQDIFIAPQLKIGPPQSSKAFWSATEWTRVFESMSARLAGLKGEKEKKVQTVDMRFSRSVRGKENMSLNIPARLTDREYLIIARLIAMYINDHIVNEGSSDVWITTSDHKLRTAIQEMLRSDYGKMLDYVRQYYQKDKDAGIVRFIDKPDQDVRPYKKNIVIGLDLGGSSKVKAVVIERGQIVYSDIFSLPDEKEAENLTNTDEYVNAFAGVIREVIARSKIMEGRQDKKENKVVYAIGISWAGAVNGKGEIAAASKIIKRLSDSPEEKPYLARIRNLGELLSKKTGFHVRVVNDGDALAFGLATYAEMKDALCLGFGTSLAVGYIDESGRLVSEFGEGSKTIADMADDSAVHTGTGVSGVAQQYAAQSGIIRVAEGYREFQELLRNVEVRDKASRVGKLVELYNINGEAVLDKVADFIAVAIAKLHRHYRMEHVILSGGVMNRESGAVILAKVREKIRANFPVVDPANIETSGTIEKMVEGMKEKVETRGPGDGAKVNYSDYANAIGAAQHANLTRQDEEQNRPIAKSFPTRKDLNQIEADGAVGSLIVLARKAKRENQRLLIGLETDWMPGINAKSSLQRSAISALMKEIDSIGETLKSMGLDNVEIIHGNSNELAGSLLDRADKTHTSLRNVVAMASVSTINSESFSPLRNADENNRPFLAGIDPAELISFYGQFGEATAKQLHIRLSRMLYMTLELASGKEPPQLPIIVSYDKKMRMVVYLPKAEPKDYEDLKNIYAAEKTALAAA